jgi:hypothetical protein
MSVIRLDNSYRMNNLPELKSNCFFLGALGCSGSRISRPVKGSLGIYKHVGFVYGFDRNNTLWIIENNINGVECITLRDFGLGGKFKIQRNTNPLLINGIILRAKERSLLPYHARDNNCEHFVNYCIGAKHESHQVKTTEALVNSLLSMAEVYLVCGGVKKEILESYSRIREHLKLNRSDSIQKILDKHAMPQLPTPVLRPRQCKKKGQ